MANRVNMGERYIHFASAPDVHRMTVKNILMTVAAPDREVVVEAGVIRRGDGTPPAGLYDCFRKLVVIAKWSEDNGTARFADWTQADADRFLDDLRTGQHRAGGVGLTATSIRGYVTTLRLLRECQAILPDALSFFPWAGRSASSVSGEVTHTENTTPPLPWETWAPLITASWVIVDRFSDDIIAAADTRAALPKEPRGPAGANAYNALLDWTEQRGLLPLHTGFGRTKHQRGEPNTTLLEKLLGINANVLNRSSHQYMPDAAALIATAAADPQRATFGGLHVPTAVVSHPDGTSSTWVEELGLGETEYLESVLRAACYVLIASLTGMRDSEIQELTRDSHTTEDGLAALKSIQHKGSNNPDAERRTWWAPRPVIRTIEVLGNLARHDTYLFARSSRNAGSYIPSRDIARLIAFVNDDPAQRPGRGRGLGLEHIAIPKGQAINATSLRRAFSVFATTRPGAELGLGIQLGHSAWRMTTGYMSDGQQRAVRLMDDERKRVLHRDAAALLQDDRPVAGPAAHHVTGFRAQIVASPDRADRLTATLAERLHLGLTNDCMWNPATSSCGGDRPKLGDHVCVGVDCTNALLRPAHIGVIASAIDRIDTYLDEQRGHPALIEQMRRDRANLARIRRELTTAGDTDDLYDDDLDQENGHA
ncbi:hypothetical protein BST32_09880 [Mycobacteroides abscessus subsp. massiliense]|nr:hypothetical protein MMAS_33520 [Mycobacteroides abscessus subsp. massiliense CCUG 48898 = JCM 15300]EIV64589.1 hypothetical protein MMCCUG48898_3501 [Mycobacteroides abscessus subsp. massiliense CCUG 48898 = JCM 15300]ORA91437.1 hypothetical protein BST32_09880 [Mycobacteroides abscessus subsp. massiliense]BAP98266.1 hypothetical protein MMASJCM_3490 [Mycobacteroides abscessus subsp. massiliense CCUG 48898 = JCM 15300]